MSASHLISLRLAKPDELAIVANLERLAFAPQRSDYEIEKDWFGGQVQLPGRSQFLAVDAEGQPVGCYSQLDLGIWLERQSIPTLGLGGVAVAPHRRGQGVARDMMDHALKAAQKQHIPLAMLYPFQQGFYRALGWAWVGETRQYRVATRDLPGFAESQQVVPFNPDAHQRGVQQAYEQGAIAQNGWLQRRDWQWETFFKPTAGQELYCYVEAGKVLGYAMGQFTEINSQWAIAVREWVALTPAAYRGILGFWAGWRDQISTVIWNTYATDPFPHLLQEQRRSPHLSTEPFGFGLTHNFGAIGSGFMWRLVDLRRALELRPIQPIAAFALTLVVEDALLGNQTLSVAFQDGRTRILDQPTDTVITLSVEQLTLVWSGVRRMTELAALGSVDVLGDRTRLSQLDAAWQTRPPFCWDFF
jgi:predicted acetyltransferase